MIIGAPKDTAEDPSEVEAVEIMARLHDALDEGGYPRKDLDRLLIRILFCLFAEDTGIFEPNAFTDFIETRTRADGTDLGAALDSFFGVLNTPPEGRQRRLDEQLRELPHVNGDLFGHRLTHAAFDAAMRDALSRCAHFDWSAISPAVFGSILQGVMDRTERRQFGAHYTSEPDIMKVLHSLFLDELEAELDHTMRLRGKDRRARLLVLHTKLANLRFLDPACGCGNFLVLAYRELRRLEETILLALHGEAQIELDIGFLNKVSVDQFYGIEILEFPAEIARVSMWLMDHQMNIRLSEPRSSAPDEQVISARALTLVGDVHVTCANALRIDWNDILPAPRCSYILGNPPFVGKKARASEQAEDMNITFTGTRGPKVLDYVCAWFRKAAEYIKDTDIEVAYVSTNSITQGEQPGLLWPLLYLTPGLDIQFAHRTFPWRSEARGKAHVHVVIIGFSRRIRPQKQIYDYDDEGAIHLRTVASINPYLVEGPRRAVTKRREPLDSSIPFASFGNMPNDGGHLLLTNAERANIIASEPAAAKFIRPFLSAKEYIAGVNRWCIWLHGVNSADYRGIREFSRRLEQVKKLRRESSRAATRLLADTAAEFGEIRQPTKPYILIPRHPSEQRRRVPMGYFGPEYIVADSCICVRGASMYHFGVLMSAMHDAWLRQVGGRIKSDLRYSVELVYNNFPWPVGPGKARMDAVAQLAELILAIRGAHAGASLGDLYGVTSMPRDLVDAHRKLDAAVDRCYGITRRVARYDRVSLLFQLWQRMKTGPSSRP